MDTQCHDIIALHLENTAWNTGHILFVVVLIWKSKWFNFCWKWNLMSLSSSICFLVSFPNFPTMPESLRKKIQLCAFQKSNSTQHRRLCQGKREKNNSYFQCKKKTTYNSRGKWKATVDGLTRTSLWSHLERREGWGANATQDGFFFSARSCNNLFIAAFAWRPSPEPQTEDFPSVSPTGGVLVFVLQCLSVL